LARRPPAPKSSAAPGSGLQTIYALIEARGAYTPANAGKPSRWNAEVEQA
jgi:hypothetical protein